jgi:hypothetical protein
MDYHRPWRHHPGVALPPGGHPGNDKILVVWPDVPPGLDKTALGEWLAASHPPEAVRTIVDEVTRNEFVRRLASLDIVSQVNANPLVRVVAGGARSAAAGGSERGRAAREDHRSPVPVLPAAQADDPQSVQQTP